MEAAAFDEAALGAEAAASLSDPAKQNEMMCKLLGNVYNANGEGHEARLDRRVDQVNQVNLHVECGDDGCAGEEDERLRWERGECGHDEK